MTRFSATAMLVCLSAGALMAQAASDQDRELRATLRFIQPPSLIWRPCWRRCLRPVRSGSQPNPPAVRM